jgi:cobalt-zinc-cadmium efflux system membrane fusion protein
MTTELIPSAPRAAVSRAEPGGGPSGLISRVRRILPTFFTLTLLVGIAFWGHASDWRIPKFSALTGHTRAEADDWCPEHHVPESACVECNASLLPRSKVAYCKTHGVPECPLDHPEIAQVKGSPQLPQYDVSQALSFLERPEASRQCKLHEHRIQFASAAAAEKAGVDIDVVQERPLAEYVTANGEVTYDQTRVAHLSSRVAGTVARVDKKVGDPVQASEVLALVDAAVVGKAKAEFLQAANRFRLKTRLAETARRLASTAALSERQLQDTETEASEARIHLLAARQNLINLGLPIGDEWLPLSEERLALHLQLLGLPDAIKPQLNPNQTSANLLPLRAPLDGVVVDREIVAGEVVDTTKTLFVIANPQSMWLTLNIRLEDAKHVRVGQPIRFRPDGEPMFVQGAVRWISPAVDPKTRTVQVRADLANADGRLLANTFGTGRIVLREEPQAVAVPNEAVQFDGDCYIVFVRDKDYLREGSPKVFHVRKVRPGARDDRFTEMLAGTLPGEVVATKGSAVLLAELLKANLGEG